MTQPTSERYALTYDYEKCAFPWGIVEGGKIVRWESSYSAAVRYIAAMAEKHASDTTTQSTSEPKGKPPVEPSDPQLRIWN